MKRLLVSILFVLFSTQVSAGIKHWTYVTEVDAFTDEVNSFASYHTGEYNEFVYVRCQNGDFDIYMGFGEFIDNEGNVKALYRIDGGEVHEGYDWSLSTEGTSIFAKDRIKIKLANHLSKGKSKASFRVYDYKGSVHDMTVYLKGSTKSINQVMNDCNVNTQVSALPKSSSRLKDTISKIYNCHNNNKNKFLIFRVDRRSDSSLVGVYVEGKKVKHYFKAPKVSDNGEELAVKFGFARMWLNYANMTARQKAPFFKGEYVCD